jgi:hypothetical protein
MERPVDNDQRQLFQRRIAIYITLIVSIMMTALTSLVESMYICEPFHTSALTGEAWVMELLSGHPEHMRNALGVNLHVFSALILELQAAGYQNPKNVFLEEQLAIYLYASMTGLTIRHLGERFQRSNETISR